MARLTKENVDEMLTIPMVGDIQSLNASVAAGLLIYQVRLPPSVIKLINE